MPSSSSRYVTDVPQAVTYLEELLGIAYYRKSEAANDVYTKPGDKCIFPFPPGFKYANSTYSEKAIQHLLKVAQLKPEDLEVRWVLNLAYMTMGTYPAAVPKEYRSEERRVGKECRSRWSP